MFSLDFNTKTVLLAGLTAEDSAADPANFDCGDEELNCSLREEALDEQEQEFKFYSSVGFVPNGAYKRRRGI